MNRKITITTGKQIKLFTNLKFEDKGQTFIKPGTTVTLEETGKVHTNEKGEDCKVLRLRKNTRNYYTLETLLD